MKKTRYYKPSTVFVGGGVLHRKEAGSGLSCLPPLTSGRGGQRRKGGDTRLTDFGEVTP